MPSWLKTFSKRTAALCGCISLLATVALGSSETDAFARRVEKCRNADDLWAAMEGAPPSVQKDRSFAWALNPEESYDGGWGEARKRLLVQLRTKSALEGASPVGRVTSPQRTTQEILSNPLYRDAGPSKRSNWLSRIGQRISDWLDRLLEGQTRPGNLDMGFARLEWLKYAAWAVLGIGAIAFLAFVVRQFNWNFERRRRRRVGGLLDDEEPERTADEWLARADDLAREGKHREAVRCLYLACLVRLDEANVARFIRSQTNWEHLERIESSPRRPEGLDFLGPTQAFDRIWYGRVTEGAPDVERFRATYTSLCESLEQAKSAVSQAI